MLEKVDHKTNQNRKSVNQIINREKNRMNIQVNNSKRENSKEELN